MNRDMYDDFSQDYDHFVNWNARLAAEMPFILAHLEQVKTGTNQSLSILDAACGSGMHAIELARRGFLACGADLSPKMISRANANAASIGVEVNFKESSFGSMVQGFKDDPLFPFNMILCLGNALPHLLSIKQIQTALWDLGNCLRPGGILLFQNRNFDAICKNRERWIEPQERTSDDEEWIFLRFYDFDSDGLITFNILRLHRKDTENWQQRVSTTRLYPLKQDTLVGLLEDSGFSGIMCYGIMDKDQPFDPFTSENLVVTARKV